MAGHPWGGGDGSGADDCFAWADGLFHDGRASYPGAYAFVPKPSAALGSAIAGSHCIFSLFRTGLGRPLQRGREHRADVAR